MVCILKCESCISQTFSLSSWNLLSTNWIWNLFYSKFYVKTKVWGIGSITPSIDMCSFFILSSISKYCICCIGVLGYFNRIVIWITNKGEWNDLHFCIRHSMFVWWKHNIFCTQCSNSVESIRIMDVCFLNHHAKYDAILAAYQPKIDWCLRASQLLDSSFSRLKIDLIRRTMVARRRTALSRASPTHPRDSRVRCATDILDIEVTL